MSTCFTSNSEGILKDSLTLRSGLARTEKWLSPWFLYLKCICNSYWPWQNICMIFFFQGRWRTVGHDLKKMGHPSHLVLNFLLCKICSMVFRPETTSIICKKKSKNFFPKEFLPQSTPKCDFWAFKYFFLTSQPMRELERPLS